MCWPPWLSIFFYVLPLPAATPAFETGIFLPLGTEAVHLDEKDYRFVDGYLPHAVRITVDRDFYEMHSDSVEFWTPGSSTFPDLEVYRT
jgi:hypothetical protein